MPSCLYHLIEENFQSNPNNSLQIFLSNNLTYYSALGLLAQSVEQRWVRYPVRTDIFLCPWVIHTKGSWWCWSASFTFSEALGLTWFLCHQCILFPRKTLYPIEPLCLVQFFSARQSFRTQTIENSYLKPCLPSGCWTLLLIYIQNRTDF